MKNLLLILIAIGSCSVNMLSQVPIHKPVVFRMAQNKKLCLKKSDSLQLILETYKELPTQEWTILPSDESTYFYLQSSDQYNLILDADSTQIVNSCHLTIAKPEGNDYKFSFISLGQNQWCISPKSNPDLCLQTYKAGDLIYAIPKQEFGTSAFIIDTIQARRPKPTYTRFNALACDAGLLVDEKTVPVFGADATFYHAGLYPAQYIVRIYLSPDRRNRIDVVVFEDIKKVSSDKIYSVKFRGPRNQPVITLVKNDKPLRKLDEAECKLSNVNWSNNSIEFRVEGARTIAPENPNKQEMYDFAFKGLIRLQ